MHGAKPAVVRMQMHLPDKQNILYEDGKEDEILNDPNNPPHSQLLGYFDAVKVARLPNAKVPKISNGLTAKDLTYTTHTTWSKENISGAFANKKCDTQR
jgi:hypothetical protein